jgi:hypothetical protein
VRSIENEIHCRNEQERACHSNVALIQYLKNNIGMTHTHLFLDKPYLSITTNKTIMPALKLRAYLIYLRKPNFSINTL